MSTGTHSIDESLLDCHTFAAKPSLPFKLSPKFVSKFKDKSPPFGFNGLGGN